MNSKNFVLIIPIVFAFVLSFQFSGVDIWFYLKIAERYAVGDLVGGFNVGFGVDHTFYPPLFMFLLVPSIWLGVSKEFIGFLNLVFLPLAVGSLEFLCYRLYGLKGGLFGGLIVFGSVAYWDRVVSPQPQSLDFILLPLVYYFVLFKNRVGSLVGSVLMVWNHGLVSVSSLGGVLLKKFKQMDFKWLIAWFVGVFVVLFLSVWFLWSGLRFYGGNVDTNQEFLFWHSWLFVPEYLGVLCVGFVFSLFFVYRWLRGLFVSSLVKMCLVSVVVCMVMIPVWVDRWLQYITVPFVLVSCEFLFKR